MTAPVVRRVGHGEKQFRWRSIGCGTSSSVTDAAVFLEGSMEGDSTARRHLLRDHGRRRVGSTAHGAIPTVAPYPLPSILRHSGGSRSRTTRCSLDRVQYVDRLTVDLVLGLEERVRHVVTVLAHRAALWRLGLRFDFVFLGIAHRPVLRCTMNPPLPAAIAEPSMKTATDITLRQEHLPPAVW